MINNKKIIIGLFVTFLSTLANAVENNFYFDAFSVKQGGKLGVFADRFFDADGSAIPYINIGISKYDDLQPTPITFINNIPSTPQTTNANAYENGAGWKIKTTSITIGKNWRSGIYRADIYKPKSNESLGYAYFIVKAAEPSSSSKILVLDNATTNIAYNEWGGKSLYRGIPGSAPGTPEAQVATSLSLLRPGQNIVQYQELNLAVWAKKNNIPVEHASMMDLESSSSLLQNYSVVIIAGHSEYWSKAMRDNFDRFIKGGGNAMILAGNTMWWQIRMDKINSKMICYTYQVAQDPVMLDGDPTNNSTATSQWWDPGYANNPENKSTGVSWRNGGYVNHPYLPIYQSGPNNDNGAYSVTNDSHWIYKDTGLKNGDIFGKAATIVGLETDGALFTIDSKGKYVVTGTDGTPLNTAILAKAESKIWEGGDVHYTTMVVTEPFPNKNGGLVFNAATMDWTDGLSYGYLPGPPYGAEDRTVSRITKNVLKRFCNRCLIF